MGNDIQPSTKDATATNSNDADKRSSAVNDRTTNSNSMESSVTKSPVKIDAQSKRNEEEESTRFRQLYRLLTLGNQQERAYQQMIELLEATKNGEGFLDCAQEKDSKVRSELRVMQHCLLSESSNLYQVACDIYSCLRPNEHKYPLWFGITQENIDEMRNARVNLLDVDLKKIALIEGLCTSSIIEDLRTLALTESSRKVQIAAMRALGVVLLHPSNRSATLFSARDVQQMTKWIPSPSLDGGDDDRQIFLKLRPQMDEEAIEFYLQGLIALEHWSLMWVSDESNNISNQPPFCRGLVLKIVDLIRYLGVNPNVAQSIDRTLLETSVRLLYLLDGASEDKLWDAFFVSTLCGLFIKSSTSPKTRFFASMLVLSIMAKSGDASLARLSDVQQAFEHQEMEELKQRFHNKGKSSSTRTTVTLDEVARVALLTCCENLAGIHDNNDLLYDYLIAPLDTSKGEVASSIIESARRFIGTHLSLVCAAIFTRNSSRFLRLPKSISFCFILGLDQPNKDREFLKMIAQVLASSDARDFALQAYRDGASLFLQNCVCQFAYSQRDHSQRELAILCCKYLVAGFAAHDLGPQYHLELYEFFCARLTESEELWRTERSLQDKKTEEEEVERRMLLDFIHLLRIGVSILYQPHCPKYNVRGPFPSANDEEDEEGEHDDDHHMDFAFGNYGDEHSLKHLKRIDDDNNNGYEEGGRPEYYQKDNDQQLQFFVSDNFQPLSKRTGSETRKGRNEADVWLNVSVDSEPRRSFLNRLVYDLFNQEDDDILRFACGRAVSSLAKKDEYAKMAMVVHTNLLGRIVACPTLNHDLLVILRDLTANPGGSLIWTTFPSSLSSNPTTCSYFVQNRSGNQISVAFHMSNGQRSSTMIGEEQESRNSSLMSQKIQEEESTRVENSQLLYLSSSSVGEEDEGEDYYSRNANHPQNVSIHAIPPSIAPQSDLFVDNRMVLVSYNHQHAHGVGSRLVHVQYGPGIIVHKSDSGLGDVSFDSGHFQRFHIDELKANSRMIGPDEDNHPGLCCDTSDGWTVLFRTGTASFASDPKAEIEASKRVRVVAQLANGDVMIGVLNRRLGCYDATNGRWHDSNIFLPDKNQTVVAVCRDRKTLFMLVDDNYRVTELGTVEYASLSPVIVSIGNGLKGLNPFGPLLEFAFFPFAFSDAELNPRLHAFDSSGEIARIALAHFEEGALLKRLRSKMLGEPEDSDEKIITPTTTERRIAASVMRNLALCPQIRLDVIQSLGHNLESLLLDMLQSQQQEEEETETTTLDEPIFKSFLDKETRRRLIEALI